MSRLLKNIKENMNHGQKNSRKKKVSVVICTYNNQDVIGETLESIRKQSFRDFDCTLVIDGSTDDTFGFVRKNFPWVKLVVLKKNQGPSIGRNIGIKATNSDFVLTMDSDAVLEKDWIAKQLSLFKELAAKGRNIGIVGCKLVYKSRPNVINSAGGAFMSCGIGYDIGSGKGSKLREFNVQKNVVYVCSAAMLVNRKMLNAVGGFDEAFFYGHEDTDLGWRANIAGYEVLYNPNAVAFHNVSETMQHRSSMLYYYAVKNRIRALIKNYSWYNVARFLPLLMALTLGDIVLRRYKLVKIKAVFWNIANFGRTLNERKRVQRLRRQSDEKIMKLMSSSWNVFRR